MPYQFDLYQALQKIPTPIWFGVLIGLCFFLSLGGVSLFDEDEGAFAAGSFEMLQRHEFITPYLHSQAYFAKPILTFWLQMISASVFGINEWGFRLPSALASAFLMGAIYRFTLRHFNRETAMAAVLFAAGSMMVVVIGRAAIADALLNLFVALSLFAIFDYTRRPQPATLRWVFVWMGLGVLAKGPVAIVFPVAVSFAFYAMDTTGQRDLKTWFKLAFRPLPWLLLLTIVLPWYVLEYLDQGQAFIDGFFLKHNIHRFSATMEGHGGHLFYYLPVLLLMFMPYTGMLAVLLTRLRNMLHEPLDRFLWLWFLCVLLFFSVSQTQLPHYLLSGAPPLFILMARYRRALRSGLLAYLPAIAFFALLLFLPDLLKQLAAQSTDLYITAVAARIDTAMGTGYYFWVGLCLVFAVLLMLLAKRRLLPCQGLHLLAIAQIFMLLYALLPAADELQQQPVRQAARKARSLDATVVLWQIRMPSFAIYRGAVTPERAPRPGEVVFTRIDKLAQLNNYELLFNEGGIVLAKIKP
ncbi:MAG: glycosyltransferase family 39 protein [Thioalkalispiraceae bacterium]